MLSFSKKTSAGRLQYGINCAVIGAIASGLFFGVGSHFLPANVMGRCGDGCHTSTTLLLTFCYTVLSGPGFNLVLYLAGSLISFAYMFPSPFSMVAATALGVKALVLLFLAWLTMRNFSARMSDIAKGRKLVVTNGLILLLSLVPLVGSVIQIALLLLRGGPKRKPPSLSPARDPANIMCFSRDFISR